MEATIPIRPQPSLESATHHAHFWVTFLIISAIYAIWMVTFWPGALGEDSLAIALEVESNGAIPSGKPIFWYYFVKIFYTEIGKFEYPIIAQLLLSSLFFSRILSWCLSQGFRITYGILLIFVCLAPHSILVIGSLYADGIYAAATIALIFEVWIISKRRKINITSFAILFTSLPFAAFARPNGIIMLAAVVGAIFFVEKPERKKIYFIIFIWISLITLGSKLHKTYQHGALYPLALFETVNFLQPRPMNLWRADPRVSEKTIQTLTKYQPLEKIIKNYDRDYWDTLIYHQTGPQLHQLTKSDREEIIKQFFTYNVWRNIPSFFGSRVNIFLTSALAQGSAPSLDYAESVISRTNSTSEFRKFHIKKFEAFFKKLHEFSYTYRIILWTALYGVVILLFAFFMGIRWRDKSIILVTIPMILQLGGIFFFSIAGEYRYLFHFFLLPLALLPILMFSKKHITLQSNH